MLPAVKLLDEMDEQMWDLLRRNLTGLTEEEADWRPHPEANTVRWMIGHLAWFAEWALGALGGDGRYLVDTAPTHFEGSIPEIMARFADARAAYRVRIAGLSEDDLRATVSFVGQYEVSKLDVLKTHALHLAGHRFQVRYVRGTYARAHGTSKAVFDPW